jgi:hypothetical protein
VVLESFVTGFVETVARRRVERGMVLLAVAERSIGLWGSSDMLSRAIVALRRALRATKRALFAAASRLTGFKM